MLVSKGPIQRKLKVMVKLNSGFVNTNIIARNVWNWLCFRKAQGFRFRYCHVINIHTHHTITSTRLQKTITPMKKCFITTNMRGGQIVLSPAEQVVINIWFIPQTIIEKKNVSDFKSYLPFPGEQSLIYGCYSKENDTKVDRGKCQYLKDPSGKPVKCKRMACTPYTWVKQNSSANFSVCISSIRYL